MAEKMELLQHLGATYTQCFQSRAVPEGARNGHGQKGRFQGDAQVQKSSVAVQPALNLNQLHVLTIGRAKSDKHIIRWHTLMSISVQTPDKLFVVTSAQLVQCLDRRFLHTWTVLYEGELLCWSPFEYGGSEVCPGDSVRTRLWFSMELKLLREMPSTLGR